MPDHLLCTVITKNYLATARALIRSARTYEPGLEAAVFVVDPIEGCFDPAKEEFAVFTLDDVTGKRPPLERMAFYFSPFEYCASLRPLAMATMLARTQAKRLLYLDSDILVTRSLAPVWEALGDTPILLSPHSLAPVPPDRDDARSPMEVRFLQYGTFNSGMVGVCPHADTSRMLAWWAERSERQKISVVPGLSPEQIWLNLVPDYFPATRSLRHPGSNVGYWRFHEGTFGKDAGGYTFAGAPLLFAHFSGWDIQQPTKVGSHGRHWDTAPIPVWAEMGEQYAALLHRCGFAETRAFPYSFARFKTGEPITPDMRRYFGWLDGSGQAGEESPFERAAFFHREMDRIPRGLVGRAIGRLRRAFGDGEPR